MMPDTVSNMTDMVAVALVTSGFSFLSALLGVLNNRLTRKGNHRILALERTTNGRLDQLLESRIEAAYQKGLLAGRGMLAGPPMANDTKIT